MSCLNRAPLSLERSTSASIIVGTEGSANTRLMDPHAELQATTERNVRVVREELEEVEQQKAAAAKAAQEESHAVAKAQADAVAKERANAVARA